MVPTVLGSFSTKTSTAGNSPFLKILTKASMDSDNFPGLPCDSYALTSFKRDLMSKFVCKLAVLF